MIRSFLQQTGFVLSILLTVCAFRITGAESATLVVLGDTHEWNASGFANVFSAAKSQNAAVVIPGDILTHRYNPATHESFNPKGMPKSGALDQFDRTHVYNQLQKSGTVPVVIVPGNHDFDRGIENFSGIVRGKGNSFLKNVHLLDYFLGKEKKHGFSASWTHTVNNVKILFVGLGAWQDLYSGGGKGADNSARNVTNHADRLTAFKKFITDKRKEVNSDFVVVVTHQKFAADCALSKALGNNGKAANLILGGHDHSVTTFKWDSGRKCYSVKCSLENSHVLLPIPILKTGKHFEKKAFSVKLTKDGKAKNIAMLSAASVKSVKKYNAR